MNKQFRIEPSEANPEPLPQSGGQWLRDDDGGLRPADRATAEGAGLSWPEGEMPQAAEVPAEAEQGVEAKKRAR